MLKSVVDASKAEQAADVRRYQDDADRIFEVYIDIHNLVSGLGQTHAAKPLQTKSKQLTRRGIKTTKQTTTYDESNFIRNTNNA